MRSLPSQRNRNQLFCTAVAFTQCFTKELATLDREARVRIPPGANFFFFFFFCFLSILILAHMLKLCHDLIWEHMTQKCGQNQHYLIYRFSVKPSRYANGQFHSVSSLSILSITKNCKINAFWGYNSTLV